VALVTRSSSAMAARSTRLRRRSRPLMPTRPTLTRTPPRAFGDLDCAYANLKSGLLVRKESLGKWPVGRG
jgi:hypothetical protein